MAISPGSGYKIKITVAGIDSIEEQIDVEKLQKFVEIRKDFYMYSPGFENKKNQISVKIILDSLINTATSVDAFKNDAVINNVVDANKSTPTATPTASATPTSVEPVKPITNVPCDGATPPDFSAVKGKSLNDPAVYKQFLDIGGNMCAEGMVFKIQIAAYQHPENYKYGHLKQFGKPEEIKYPDGITRFTQLSFATIKEAEVARQKIIAKGQKDAWITVFIDGKRFTLEELILVNFNGKTIN